MIVAIAALLETITRCAMQQYLGRSRKCSDREPTASDDDAFVLGTAIDLHDGDGSTVILRTPDRKRHMYVLGATGSGKTNLLLRLIEADAKAGRCLVVLDLRGDLIDRVLLLLAQSDLSTDRVCLIDLRDERFIPGFNPLSGSGETHSRALHVLGVLRSQADSWGVQLDETLRNTLVVLAESGGTICDIEPLLTDERSRAHFLKNASDPFACSFFERFDDLSADRQTALTLPVLNKVTPLIAVPRIRKLLGNPKGLDVKTLLDRPGQITLVGLAVDRLHGAGQLVGGLLVSAIQHAVMARADVPENERNPVLLYVDEFETMASENFGAIVAEGRRFGLYLVLSHQNLYQLPNELRQVIRNNVGLQLFFQTGSLDANDLAGEIFGLGTKDEVKSLLIGQGIGEAVLIRRGHASGRVRTPLCIEPSMSAEEIRGCIARSQAIRTDDHHNDHAPSSKVRHDRLPSSQRWRS